MINYSIVCKIKYLLEKVEKEINKLSNIKSINKQINKAITYFDKVKRLFSRLLEVNYYSYIYLQDINKELDKINGYLRVIYNEHMGLSINTSIRIIKHDINEIIEYVHKIEQEKNS